MKLPEFSVNKRVTASMIGMILVVVGFISLSRLGLDFFPDLEYPTVSVVTTYSGASSEDMEKAITEPVEQVVGSVSGVKTVRSITNEGSSVVMVEFEWGTSLDFAAQDLRDQIGLYRNFLPPDASDPLVVKFNLAQFPILFYGITADMPTFQLKKLIEDNVAPRLERIDGVAAVQVFSIETREILVDIDKNAVASQNISLDNVLAALRAGNLNMPAGNIVERQSDLLVRSLGEYKTLDDVRRTVVGASPQGAPIYLGDIAEVKDTIKETRNVGRIQGKSGVFMFVSKRSGANTAIAGSAVKKEMENVKRDLPSHLAFFTVMDMSDMIRSVAQKTVNNAWQGGLLAIILIFLFLWNWRPTLIIALAIPLSIVTTFISFYAAGYTLNLLTLGGLTLGVGMLVDNAIVVIENTFRHMQEERSDYIKASIMGASEVGMAITASTLTTVVVFFPMIFAQGITGRLTRSLALAITFSLISSLFIALTIVPLLSSLLFKSWAKRYQGGFVETKKMGSFERPKNLYRKWLTAALHHRRWVLGGAIAVFILSIALIPFLGTGFMPAMDANMILLKIKMPVGTSLQETNRVLSVVEDVMLKQPEVQIVTAQAGSSAEENPGDAASEFAAAGTHEGIVWVGLKKKGKGRNLTDAQVLEQVRAKFPRLKDVKFEFLDMSTMMTGATGSPVDLKIYGKELDQLKTIADAIVSRISDVEGVRDATHSLSQGRPEYQLKIDRDRAARLGLMIGQVANTVQTATLGKVATRFRDGSEEVDLRVRFKKNFRDNIEEIKGIPLLTPLNQVVYLDQLVTVDRGEGPVSITHENQSRSVSVTANIVGRDLGSVIRDVKKRVDPIQKQLQPGYFLEYGGQYEQMQDAFVTLAGAFALAILLVYMVMASQFESFLHPFIIMFTIPLGLIGVVLGLLISGRPLNLPVMIGFILLAGIAVNNGIVMIDYINQLRKRGMDGVQAIIQGGVTRLRPVLLTALTTILGMLPMALSRSEGSEMRAPMAIAVLGGLTATTFLTLFIIPIIYSLFEKVKFRKAV